MSLFWEKYKPSSIVKRVTKNIEALLIKFSLNVNFSVQVSKLVSWYV